MDFAKESLLDVDTNLVEQAKVAFEQASHCYNDIETSYRVSFDRH